MTSSLLLQLLTQSIFPKQLNNSQWNTVLNQARAASLCYRLYLHFVEHNVEQDVPEKIRLHLYNEHFSIRHLHTQVRNEVIVINKALNKLNLYPIYLKGVAYLLADLPVSASRLFSDIDILLPKEEIQKAEIALKCLGWVSQKTDDYDQQYYREYMHEIPPMQHITRGTVLDIHHNILPICGAHTVDIKRLVLDGNEKSAKQTLSPAAIFLHCAVHLFHEGEFEKGLRDLTDLHSLYTDFSKQAEFDQQLLCLAQETELERSLYYAIHYLQLILKTPIGPKATAFIEEHRKQLTFNQLRDFIFMGVLIPHHKSCHSWQHSLAKMLAYFRGHFIRMPLKLLIPHLLKKMLLPISSKSTPSVKKRPNF